MRQVSISELKLLKTGEIKRSMPLEITSDGEVIAVLSVSNQVEEVKEPEQDIFTKCPNCKMVYKVIPPDNLPSFFSCQTIQ